MSDEAWISFGARSAGDSSASPARKIRAAITSAGACAPFESGRGRAISNEAAGADGARPIRRKFLVLARTYWDAEHWRHALRRSDVIYAGGTWKIDGLLLSQVDGVLLPSFYDRHDVRSLEDCLRRNAAKDAGTDWPLWRQAAIERSLL